MADLFIGLGAVVIGILLIVAGVKGMRRDKKPRTNPEGLTRDEFIERYRDTPHIAEICWFFGIYPAELKEELETLLMK